MAPQFTDPEALNAAASTMHLPVAQLMIQELLHCFIIRPEDWNDLATEIREELSREQDTRTLLARLVAQKLLTDYQATRIGQGRSQELILANYRILTCLGRGSMGVVFQAEHLYLRRLVAIKLLNSPRNQPQEAMRRFQTEVWAIGQLQHPNIVAALDAGQTSNSDPDLPSQPYLVMEFIPGQDLKQFVEAHGPLPPEKACELTYQIASALEDAHNHKLVHRDIKPSNIRVTPEGQAKLLDFGLARHFGNRLTEPGTVLGTMDYLPPEQARDARAVDIRSDIYTLGGTLFWCLTGRVPFPSQGSVMVALVRRQNQAPPSVRAFRPEIPAELDAVIARMMAVDPDDRYPTPQAVMRSVFPFLEPVSAGINAMAALPLASNPLPKISELTNVGPYSPRTLVVDDEAANRQLCRWTLEPEGIGCEEAGDGMMALEAVWAKPFDLILLDIDMPKMKGTEVLARLREQPPGPNLKIIMLSGRATGDEMAQMMTAGADDYLTKPYSVAQLVSRVKAALRLKQAQDRSNLLHHQMLKVNHELEQNLHARDSDLLHARNALVMALAELVTYRDTETGSHLLRLQAYCRLLAEEAAGAPGFAGEINAPFIHLLECCAPLHDIGKVGLPDHILLKPGPLTTDERLVMQTHTTIGAAVLQKVSRQYGFAVAFLQMAIDVTRHHHERYDGTGYPDRLVGNAIPLAARIVSVGDVYDAMRSRRVYKPGLSHGETVRFMTEASPGQFDPALLQLFQRSKGRFEMIFRELTG